MTTFDRARQIGRDYGASCAESDILDRERTPENLTAQTNNTVCLDLDRLVRSEWPDMSIQDRQILTQYALNAARVDWARTEE